MKQKKLKAKLLKLEKKYWVAMKKKDVDTAVRLNAEPTLVAGAQGASVVGRAAFKKMMKGGTWTLQDFKFSDVECKSLADDIAVLAYTVDEKLTVDGKPLKVKAVDTSTWIKRKGKWRCAAHTESLMGDPFGRDRKHVS